MTQECYLTLPEIEENRKTKEKMNKKIIEIEKTFELYFKSKDKEVYKNKSIHNYLNKRFVKVINHFGKGIEITYWDNGKLFKNILPNNIRTYYIYKRNQYSLDNWKEYIELKNENGKLHNTKTNYAVTYPNGVSESWINGKFINFYFNGLFTWPKDDLVEIPEEVKKEQGAVY